MQIPTVLINATLSEFKAEGYDCTQASATTEGNNQTIVLIFNKKEEE